MREFKKLILFHYLFYGLLSSFADSIKKKTPDASIYLFQAYEGVIIQIGSLYS